MTIFFSLALSVAELHLSHCCLASIHSSSCVSSEQTGGLLKSWASVFSIPRLVARILDYHRIHHLLSTSGWRHDAPSFCFPVRPRSNYIPLSENQQGHVAKLMTDCSRKMLHKYSAGLDISSLTNEAIKLLWPSFLLPRELSSPQQQIFWVAGSQQIISQLVG